MGTRSLVVASLTALLGVAFGCGDDSGVAPAQDAGDDSRDSGSNDPTPFQPRPRDSGTTPAGPGDVVQDDRCFDASECVEGLACVGTGLIDSQNRPLMLCEQPCETHSDCGDGRCLTRTGAIEDQHCINAEADEFAPCGIAFSSLCGRDRTCLLLNDLVGVCVDLCPLGGDGDAGVDPASGPELVECKPEQTCLDLLVDGAGRGVCMTVGARGDACGPDIGVECDTETDVCAPVDPADTSGEWQCFQDCTERSVTCDTGTCRDYQGFFAYCR